GRLQRVPDVGHHFGDRARGVQRPAGRRRRRRGYVDLAAPSDNSNNLGFTAGPGWHVAPGNGTPSGNAGNKNNSIHPEYQIVTASGNYAATGTLNTNANGKWATAIVSYKADLTDHFQVTASANPVTSGTSFTVTVRAVDASNNGVVGHRGTVTLTG